MNLKRKEPKQLGINTKAFKKDEIKSEADNKKQLVKELHSCMKCKYFWGNDNRCINNKKCGSKNSANCNAYKPKDSKCIGCPYGKDNLYCFPCMKDLLGE